MRMLRGIVIAALMLQSGFAGAPASLRMATTTSTENSGLLKVLLPAFTRQSGIKVQVIAVGTGKALKLGANGDVDVVLVHARAAEDAFVDSGFGVNRHDVMYNDFVVVGPENDPAKVAAVKGVAAAFAAIADNGGVFVSRADQSGTHIKEIALWNIANRKLPEGTRYISAGQGMGEVLLMAHEKKAYTLTDRATLAVYKKKLALKIVCEGDTALYNPYGIIGVNPKHHSNINADGAAKLITWITSPEGRALITGYTIDGMPLFFPLPKQ